MVEALGAIPFDPEMLTKLGRSNQIFDIIQGSKSIIIDKKKIRKRLPNNANAIDRIHREAEIIGHIPDCFGKEFSNKVFNSKYRDNASMFDFINVFTEYAKDQSIQEKIEIEEKSGVLADWIAKNKKKFVAQRVLEDSSSNQFGIFD